MREEREGKEGGEGEGGREEREGTKKEKQSLHVYLHTLLLLQRDLCSSQ